VLLYGARASAARVHPLSIACHSLRKGMAYLLSYGGCGNVGSAAPCSVVSDWPSLVRRGAAALLALHGLRAFLATSGEGGHGIPWGDGVMRLRERRSAGA